MDSTIPADFAYKWESVGAGFFCAFCPPGRHPLHAWRAYSEKYGQAYVCPQHLLHLQTGLGGESRGVWLAIRAAKIKSFREQHEMLQEWK